MPTTRAPLSFRDLAGHGAHRAGGRGDHHGVTGLGLAEVQQADVRGEARHAERTQREGGAGHVAEGLQVACPSLTA
jgi:hypothetical protein